jgi:hypothetical protein
MLLAGAMAIGASPAGAQVPDATVLNIMRECAKIDDPTSRLACYDNNIRSGGFGPAIPGQNGRVSGGGAPNQGGGGYGAQGFGSEDVKSPDRFQGSEERGFGPDSVSLRVASVRQRQPGVYLITLESGAEWLFSESAPRSFRPPSKGDTVDISRASLGSFLFRFDNQPSVRVRRVK